MNDSHLDRLIFYTVLGLMAISIIMVYSSSAFFADKHQHDHLYYLKRQLLWVFLGITLMLISYKFPYEILIGKSFVLVGLSIALLLYLLIKDSGRWIHFGYLNIQVSDIARLSLIIFLADSLHRKKEFLKEMSGGFFPHLFYVLLFAGLVVFQPDFSSAAMIVIIGLAIMFISPIPFKHFFVSFIATLPPAAYLIWTSVYKLARIKAFLSPESDPLGGGYHIIQSLISLGAGGIAGVGFAQSSQKLFFLPEAHTDFIFSIIGEEWGFLGTVFVLLLYFILMWRGLSIVSHAHDDFSRYLAFGLTINIITYALFNIMVTAHLVPPTGLPLPFVSYGGSSMLICSISAGLLLNISGKTYSKQQISNNRFASRARRNLEKRKLRYVQ